MKEFGFTVENIVSRVKALLNNNKCEETDIRLV